jgi:hypothetical protein
MLKNEEAKKQRTEESEKILFCLFLLPTANCQLPTVFLCLRVFYRIVNAFVAKKSNQELTK